MATTLTYGTLSASEHDAHLRKAIIASTIGTTIEWYDFFLYGTAAGLIFGKIYFPNEAPLAATLAAPHVVVGIFPCKSLFRRNDACFLQPAVWPSAMVGVGQEPAIAAQAFMVASHMTKPAAATAMSAIAM